MKRKLTPKQEMFVKEYLVDLNATQAAIRAGYSAKTAKEQASMLLTKLNIQDAIQKAMQKRAESIGRTAHDVLRDLITIKESAMLHDEKREALRALELEGKHYGMFTDRVVNEGELNINITKKYDAGN